MTTLSIAIAHWNVRDLLDGCLESIYATAHDLSFEVIVVDDASSDGSAAMVRTKYPQVRLIENSMNLGFAVATNHAIRASNGRYILLLNSDMVVHPGALQNLVRVMDEKPGVGVLGCRLIFPDGTTQPSCYHFATVGNMLVHALFLHRLLPKPWGLERLICLDYDTEHPVDWLMASCMLLRREVIEQIGLLDENIFVGGGDQDYCFRAWRAGWCVWYTPEASVTHYHGKSTFDYQEQDDSRAAEWRSRSLFEGFRSQYQFFTVHRGQVDALAYWLVAKLGAAIRLLLWGLARISKRYTSRTFYSQTSFASAMWRILVSGRPL
jgi:hypothetical protein